MSEATGAGAKRKGPGSPMTHRAWWDPPCICFGDNLPFLQALPSESVDFIYIDPPFNTRQNRRLQRVRVQQDPRGTRVGFHDRRYRVEVVGEMAYPDRYPDYLGFLAPRLKEALRILKVHGSLILHLDPREVHYVRVLLDALWGPERFLGEIVWAYDYGGRPRKRWAPKHDTLLWYVKDPQRYRFNEDEAGRPFPAHGRAPYGDRPPGDVWWHTIVPTSGKERTGYPTQKPLGLLMRLVRAYTLPGDVVLDFFAGSGTTGEAAARLGRKFLLIDHHPDALLLMMRRLAPYQPRLVTCHWAQWWSPPPPHRPL